jgi:hypothetical protein
MLSIFQIYPFFKLSTPHKTPGQELNMFEIQTITLPNHIFSICIYICHMCGFEYQIDIKPCIDTNLISGSGSCDFSEFNDILYIVLLLHIKETILSVIRYNQ